jgi:hypothetical protein
MEARGAPTPVRGRKKGGEELKKKKMKKNPSPPYGTHRKQLRSLKLYKCWLRKANFASLPRNIEAHAWRCYARKGNENVSEATIFLARRKEKTPHTPPRAFSFL